MDYKTKIYTLTHPKAFRNWYCHKNFSLGKSKTYRWEDEIFCADKESLSKVEAKYKGKEFWSEQADYSLLNIFPVRYANQYKMIFEDFLPRFDYKNANIIDIGCAAGEWTAKIAPFCKSIDGYEYSEKQVNTANEKWKVLGGVI